MEMIEYLKTPQRNGVTPIADRFFSVDRMAEDFGMGRKQLTKKCKNLYRVTPGRLIRELRHERCLRILENGFSGSNKELARACGYTGGEGLNNMIKKTTGLTTTELRKSYERGN